MANQNWDHSWQNPGPGSGSQWQAPNDSQQQRAWQATQQTWTGDQSSTTAWGAPPQQTQGQGFYEQQPAGAGWQGGAIGGYNAQKPQAWPASFSPASYDLGNPMLNVGLQAGAHMMQEQAEQAAKRYMPGMNSFWGNLKRYFNVNNVFVLKKLSMLLFPFGKKEWSRTATLDPPSQDPNSPDLYVPVMALSTYVLTVGLAKGSTMTFDPEVIVDTFGTSVMLQLVQVGLLIVSMKVFVPWTTQVTWLELLAFTGYQFVGVAVNMIIGLLFGHFFYIICLLWTASCAAFVMTQTMRAAIPPPEPGQRGKRRRINFFIFAAVLQVVMMWFLGYTRELRSNGMFSITGANAGSSIPPILPTATAFDSMAKPGSPDSPSAFDEASEESSFKSSSKEFSSGFQKQKGFKRKRASNNVEDSADV